MSVLKSFPNGTKVVNVSLDCVVSGLKIEYPKGVPYQVKPGQKLVVTVRGIEMEVDEEAYHHIPDFGMRGL